MNKKLIIPIISALLCINMTGCKTINISFDDTNSDKSSSTTSSSSSVSTESTESADTSSVSETSSSSNSSSSTASEAKPSSTESSTKSSSSEAKTETPDVNVVINNSETKYVPVPVYPVIPQKIYYSNSYIFPQSSYSYLTKSQVASLSNYELGIARNEIYARHGYTFDLAQFRNYFNSQAWYTPISKNVTLNKIENYNVALIKAEENRRGIKW